MNTKYGPAEAVRKSEVSWIPDPMSYPSLVRDFNRFRASGRLNSDIYDMPGQVFFRVLFHFDNGSDAIIPGPGTDHRNATDINFNAWTGLIAPSWLDFARNFTGTEISHDNLETLWRSSTAFNYLILNNEINRAKQLKQFVELLSTISTDCPWYFQNIKGLETAIDRQVVSHDFQFKEERDKITIECLDDSYDQRIGTLLDLYRAIVWSWETKREMLPSNLRKFDMTIVAFQMPLRGQHVSRNDVKMNTSTISDIRSDERKGTAINDVLMTPNGPVFAFGDNTKGLVASYKAWEFHGCEIDYNSSKSGWSDLNNAQGSVPKYDIEIFFDDMFETRYNEFSDAVISDVQNDDVAHIYDDDLVPVNIEDNETIAGEMTDPTTGEESQLIMPKISSNSTINSILNNPTKTEYVAPDNGILNQLLGAGKSWLNTKIKKIYLGNLNGLSIANIGRQLGQALEGNLWATINNVNGYIKGNYGGGNAQLSSNIFPTQETQTKPRSIYIGNLFKANTALNS